MKAVGLILLAFPNVIFGSSGDNPGETIIHHLLDSEIVTLFHIGSLKISFTSHSLMLFISAAIVSILFITAFRKESLVPRGLGLFLEPVVFFVRDSIVIPAMGEEMGKKWLPFFSHIILFYSHM